MNDPIDEIFNGTPDGIDPDELKEMNDARAERREQIRRTKKRREPLLLLDPRVQLLNHKNKNNPPNSKLMLR